MADVARTLAALQTLFADNTAGDISAQDLRDFLVSTYQPQAVNGFRLTLESGVPVSTSDQTAKTNVYLTPYLHNCIGVYDGSSWKQYTSSELTLALGTLTSGLNYDVFVYDNSGTLTLEALAWTNDTTRATAITLQDGVYCKSGALTRRYLGTFRTTATTTTEDSLTKRFLWNAYNQVERPLYKHDSTASWTYGTATWRQARASTANQVEGVVGVSGGSFVGLSVTCLGPSAATYYTIGIGEDSTSSPAANSFTVQGDGSASFNSSPQPHYFARPAIGYHYWTWLEKASAGVSCTFYGAVNDHKSGITGGLTA